MSRILDPKNDWDYAELVLHNAECEAYKVIGAEDKDVPICDKVRGKLKNPIRKGEIAHIAGKERGLVTSEVVDLKADDAFGQIRLLTKSGSEYVLDQVDEVKRHRKMALLYLRRGYLDFKDRIDDGFYDGGKTVKFALDGGLRFASSDREIIIYDAKNDSRLEYENEVVSALLDPVEDIQAKVKILALYVSNSLGGSQNNREAAKNLEVMMNENIEIIATPNDNGVKKIFIGDLNYGVCRQRSGKFKYLADRTGIPSRLLRGGYGPFGGAHAWNIVKIGEDYYLVDVMQKPTKIIKTTEDAAQFYRRKGIVKGFEGGAGEASVINSMDVLRRSLFGLEEEDGAEAGEDEEQD